MKGCVKREGYTAWRVVDSQAVIVSPKDSEVTILNEVGTVIWKLTDGSRQISEIAKEVCKKFDVSRDAAEKDIGEFLKDLKKKKLITPLKK